MSIENSSNHEKSGLRGNELPRAHTEILESTHLENLSKSDVTRMSGEHFYEQILNQLLV